MKLIACKRCGYENHVREEDADHLRRELDLALREIDRLRSLLATPAAPQGPVEARSGSSRMAWTSMSRREPLGSPARVRVTKVIRTSYRIEWEYDGLEFWWDETGSNYRDVRKLKVRHMQRRKNAYRAAAMRLIFGRRDKFCPERNEKGYPDGCRLCAAVPARPDDPSLCRYHGGEGFEKLRDRLARWLLWRDSNV